MMKPSLIEIAALPGAATLPLELLEDFADATPGWWFLDDESAFVSIWRMLQSLNWCAPRRESKGR